MVEVVLSRLGLDAANKAYVVVLQEKEGERQLQIWIGQHEAESIVLHVHNIARPRPLTHDLCKNIIRDMGGTLARVEITHVENSTYYAAMHVARGDRIVRVDARPSDSIAIALRMAAPIFAADELLTDAAEIMTADESETDSSGTEGSGLSAEDLKSYIEKLRPEDLGEFDL